VTPKKERRGPKGMRLTARIGNARWSVKRGHTGKQIPTERQSIGRGKEPCLKQRPEKNWQTAPTVHEKKGPTID